MVQGSYCLRGQGGSEMTTSVPEYSPCRVGLVPIMGAGWWWPVLQGSYKALPFFELKVNEEL